MIIPLLQTFQISDNDNDNDDTVTTLHHVIHVIQLRRWTGWDAQGRAQALGRRGRSEH